jgi:hypothetical protein
MMSSNVRKLVIDPFPVLPYVANLALWLAICGMSAAWMTGGISPNLMMIFSASIATQAFSQKARIWLTLPVSRKELGRAQWWYLWGLPFLAVIVVTAIAFGLDLAFGWLGVSGEDVFAIAGAEITLLFALGAVQPATRILHSAFGNAGPLIGFPILIVTLLVLGWRWSYGEDFQSVRPEIFLGTVVSGLITLFAFIFCERLPAIVPNNGKKNQVESKKSPAVRRKSEASTGWRSLFHLPLKMLMYLILTFAVLAGSVFLFSSYTALDSVVDPALVIQFIPFIGTIAAIGFVPSISQRVLAGLPVPTITRVSVLHLISFVMQAPLFAAMIVAVTMIEAESITWAWVIGQCLVLMMALAISGILLPLALRLGQQNTIALTGIFAVPVVIGSLISTATNAVDANYFGMSPGQEFFALTVISVTTMIIGWIWTFVELARGRSAYRYMPMQPATWRGSNG